MDRPDWVSAPDWARLEPVLGRQPAHVVRDALGDLEATAATWDAPSRAALLERFVTHAESGAALPAAFIHALTELLGAARHE